jgi:PhnB protein
MTSTLNPYLNFRGQAREAMDFYQRVFGGEVQRSTFAEFGMSHDPAEGEQIMHSQLRSPSGFVLMAADVPADMPLTPGGTYSISLSGDDEAELRGYWDGLADGATVTVPLERAPWGDVFGMLVDRFGVSWLVDVAGPAPA